MQYRKLTELKKLEGNPRIIRDKQFKTLCDSIRDNSKYFEARPLILSNRTGQLVIIAGNQRYEAAKALKLKEEPTFLIEGLTEDKEKEIVIRDNISNGEFDMDVLANAWGDLPLVEWGVNIPGDFAKSDDHQEKPESVVPDKDPNILVRVSFHPGVWLGKREEIITILEKLKKTYGCDFKVEE